MKKYVRPWVGPSWFTKRPGYFMFMIRELTAVFVAVYLVVLLVFLSKVNDSAAFIELLKELTSPGWRILHALVLIGSLWHSITWHNLTGKVMPVFIGEKKAPGPLIAFAMGYLPWIVISILIMWAICP